MKYILFLSVLFMFLPCIESYVAVPDNYRGLKFEHDTLNLKKTFPPTETHKFVLKYNHRESDDEIRVYTVVYRKGYVDSVKLYFWDNRFAMAVDYYFPGEYQLQTLEIMILLIAIILAVNLYWSRLWIIRPFSILETS